LIGGWNLFFGVSLGCKILILKTIGGQIILNSCWLLKDEEAIDWKGRFQSFHGARGTSSRKVMEAYQERGESLGLKKRKRKIRNGKKRKLVLMCGKVLFMRDMCVRIKHGRISMTKLLEFYFK
jgi:hypothetical protein